MSASSAATAAARVALVGFSAYMLLTAATLEGADRDLFGITFDGRWLYIVTGLLGFGALLERRLVTLWAVVMTAPTLGRAVTLWVDGSPEVVSRNAEVRGGFGWLLFWLFGALIAIVLEGTANLRRSIGR